ncbi:hypothetical protein GCM10010441_61750 [Kitasatospora paracochleata]
MTVAALPRTSRTLETSAEKDASSVDPKLPPGTTALRPGRPDCLRRPDEPMRLLLPHLDPEPPLVAWSLQSRVT